MFQLTPKNPVKGETNSRVFNVFICGGLNIFGPALTTAAIERFSKPLRAQSSFVIHKLKR